MIKCEPVTMKRKIVESVHIKSYNTTCVGITYVDDGCRIDNIWKLFLMPSFLFILMCDSWTCAGCIWICNQVNFFIL